MFECRASIEEFDGFGQGPHPQVWELTRNHHGLASGYDSRDRPAPMNLVTARFANSGHPGKKHLALH